MSMMCPPHSVKIVSTPSFFKALATRCPPETTLASRVFFFSVSSAVVLTGVPETLSTVAFICCLRSKLLLDRAEVAAHSLSASRVHRDGLEYPRDQLRCCVTAAQHRIVASS